MLREPTDRLTRCCRIASLALALSAHGWVLASLAESPVAIDSGQPMGESVAAVAIQFIRAHQPPVAELPVPDAITDTTTREIREARPTIRPQEKTVSTDTSQPADTAPAEAVATSRSAVTAPAPETETPATSSPAVNTDTGVNQTPLITEPVFAAAPTPPRYPALARKRGQQGTVWIDIWLDAQGRQTRLDIIDSSGLALLDQAALGAVREWRFRPHRINGVQVASRVRIPIEFSLN